MPTGSLVTYVCLPTCQSTKQPVYLFISTTPYYVYPSIHPSHYATVQQLRQSTIHLSTCPCARGPGIAPPARPDARLPGGCRAPPCRRLRRVSAASPPVSGGQALRARHRCALGLPAGSDKDAFRAAGPERQGSHCNDACEPVSVHALLRSVLSGRQALSAPSRRARARAQSPGAPPPVVDAGII